MIYSPLVRNAMSMAYIAHAGQFDKGGYPYIHHPLHIAEEMPDEFSCVAALLHDVLEDGDVTVDDLNTNGIPEPVIEAIVLLTREPGTPYLDYVSRLSANEIARRVKLADLRHNSDCSRLGENAGEQSQLIMVQPAHPVPASHNWSCRSCVHYWNGWHDPRLRAQKWEPSQVSAPEPAHSPIIVSPMSPIRCDWGHFFCELKTRLNDKSELRKCEKNIH